MIIPYLNQEQFVTKLTITILLQIIIMVCMANFAKRQPTDFDTKYMRRWRIIMGITWLILAFSQIFTINEYSLPLYYLATYGTMTPTEDIINTGVSKYQLLYPNVVWGHLTFKQWLIESNIENALRCISIGLYFILFKPSSVRKWVKVRKFIGYFILLFILPATVNFHYFSLIEFSFIILTSCSVWLLVRNYKHDAVVPVCKSTPISYDGKPIDDFVSISPIESITAEQDFQDKNPPKDVLHRTDKSKKEKSHKLILIFLCILNTILFLSSILFAILANNVANNALGYDYTHGYKYYEDWGLYTNCYMREKGYSYIDENLGTPVHPKRSLYIEFYRRYSDGTYYDDYNHYNQPMYVRFLNYKKNNNLYSSLFEYLQKKGYQCEYISGSNKIVFWDKIKNSKRMYYESYGVHHNTYYWTRKHLIQESDDMVYETIIYMMDSDIYDDTIEKKFTIDCPYDTEKPIHSKTYQIIYLIICIVWIINTIVILILYLSQLKSKKTIKNIKAYKLLIYMSICLIIEYITHLIIVLLAYPLDGGDDFEILFIFIGIFGAYLLLIRMPLFVYLCKSMYTEQSDYFLAPQWLQNYIKTYSLSEAPIRTCVAFILYPLYYLCTLPLGIAFLAYVIPAIIIYIIALFINWAINGMKESL